MSTETSPEVWTTRRLLQWMTQRFETKRLEAPRIVAEMLLAHVLGCERMRLYMEVDRPASAEELVTLRELVSRASRHEPVQYLVGRASFFTREFLVDPSTIIPQPATEDLVSAVIDWCRPARSDRDVPATEVPEGEGPTGESTEPGDESADEPPGSGGPASDGVDTPPSDPLIADIGTGSGCIAVSLAIALPGARVLATDIAPAALALARRNAERLTIDGRIEFLEGSLLDPLRAGSAGPFDVICSNPPYISDAEWEGGEVDESVRRHVPESATRGGRDGLDFIRPLIAGAGDLLAPGGLLAIEIGHAQRDAALELVRAAGNLESPRVLRDYEGLWRVLLAEATRPEGP